MAYSIDRDSTRIIVDCTLQPHGVTDFLYWLNRHKAERSTLDNVTIMHNGWRHPHNNEADISMCQIYHILELLPAVDTFHLDGMVFVPCTLNGHGPGVYHTPRPPSPLLVSLHLTRIAIRYPFGLDPVHLTMIGPTVHSLYMSEWLAIPHSRSVSELAMALRHPHAELGPSPPIERNLVNFEVTFPSLVDRRCFRITDEWYDFTLQLPSDRGTRNLVLKDIDAAAASTAVSIIIEDVATLETLNLGFAHDFQSASPFLRPGSC